MKVRVVSAVGGDEILVSVEPYDPVFKIKEIAAEHKRIPPQNVVLVFRGHQLDDHISVEKAGIGPMDSLYLIVRTEGG